MNTQFSTSWTNNVVMVAIATTVVASNIVNSSQPYYSSQHVISNEYSSTTQLKGFVNQVNELFISEDEAKDLLARLDSFSPVSRLPDNISEEDFLAFIQS